MLSGVVVVFFKVATNYNYSSDILNNKYIGSFFVVFTVYCSICINFVCLSVLTEITFKPCFNAIQLNKLFTN